MDGKEVFFVAISSAFLLMLVIGFAGFAMADDAFANVGLGIIAKVKAPGNFSITINQTNGNAILNWSSVPHMDGYKIWHSDNVTEILQLQDNYNVTTTRTANVTINDNTTVEWIDTNAGSNPQRYYALASFVDDRMKAVNYSVGKYDLTIYDETSIKHTFLGLLLKRNSTVDEVSIANDYCWILTVDETKNDTWAYAYSLNNEWKGVIDMIGFGKGYYFNDFSSQKILTNFGEVPEGNITQLIHDEINVQQTALGWESITSNGSLSKLINPPNDFCWILTVDETKNDTWAYAYSLNNEWKGYIDEFEPEKGYFFNDFSSERNLIYERNPY